jgi:membrane-bound lytic murein transglycosylase D
VSLGVGISFVVRHWALVISSLGFLLLPVTVRAADADNSADIDALIRSADQWAKENLDEDALRVLRSVDQERVKEVFGELQKQFHGQYVFDLAALKETARSLVPVLESYEETLPYAIWLKTRLDYLDVADQLKRRSPPPPKAAPGKPIAPPANPAAQAEREIWITKMAERPWPKPAKTYVPKLKPIFAGQNVPSELVWVAEVESSFDPRARSMEGAAGLFQLMPATAKRYGLRTFPFDQRLKPEPSAQAASKYLRYLYGHYKDWRLALAAYNAGEGTVDRLLKKQKKKTFDAIATQLPAETQMFVPKVEATVLRREGLRLAELKNGA